MADTIDVPLPEVDVSAPSATVTPGVQVVAPEPPPVNPPRSTGQAINSLSGDFSIVPRLNVRPRMAIRGVYEAAKDEEVATLVVKGHLYEDWESVWVYYNLDEVWAQFRFNATEDDPATIQFSPGDDFELYLGGYPVMTGVVLVRQTAYDAKQHAISIQGVSLTWFTARASIVDKDTTFEGPFLEIAAKVLAPTCSGFHTWGNIPSDPFPPSRAGDGEKIFTFLERLGRMINVFVVSDPYGDFVFVGEHGGQVVADLVEGQNILKMQCVIKDIDPYDRYIIKGQTVGSDKTQMRQAAEQEAMREGTATCYSPEVVAAEHPVYNPEQLKLRADHEYNFSERKVEADITVQGWFNPITGWRWDAGQEVYVISPMAMLDMTMIIQAVTFTQDSRSGSLTVLKCVAPWNWNDSNYHIGTGNSPHIVPPASAAAVNSAAATTPPEQTPHSQDTVTPHNTPLVDTTPGQDVTSGITYPD